MRIRYRVLVLGLMVGLTPSSSAQVPKPADRKSLARGQKFAEAGRADLFLASSAAWGLPADDDRNWDSALKLAFELARGGKLKQWPPNDMPKAFLSVAEYRAYRFAPKPVFKVQEQPYELPDKLADGTDAIHRSQAAVLAPGVSSPRIYGSIILSRGDVKARRAGLANSVVFATGDVTVVGPLSLAIVVCDGDVTVGGYVGDALVVARGSIHVKDITYQSVLVAGGKVKIEKPTPNLESHTTIKEDETYPFRFMRFFELSRVGVRVSEEDKVVRILEIDAPKAFAAAGAKEGDVVEGVNGAKPDSAESLRRLLRDALALGDATVTVRRADGVHSLKVALPE